ncbi:MAG TPA: hypothetical protein VD999_03930 [Vitreimonas sp.]|nr:hypothetical protein [Vitreimonas sp.]
MKQYLPLLAIGFVCILVGAGLYLKPLLPLTPSGSPQPASVGSLPLQGERHVEQAHGYSVIIPHNLELQRTSSYSAQLITKNQPLSQGPANLIYLSAIPPQSNNEGEIYNYSHRTFTMLQPLEIGKSVSLSDSGQPEFDRWLTYTRVDDVTIDGLTVKSYENTEPWEFPTGTTERRFLLEHNGYRYVFGYFTGGEGVGTAAIDPREALAIIQSIDLTP